LLRAFRLDLDLAHARMSRAELQHCRERETVPTVQYSTAQHSTAQYSTAQYSTAQYSTAQYSTVQYSTVQYSTAQHSTVQHSTVQYSTAQYSTVQYTVALQMPSVRPPLRCMCAANAVRVLASRARLHVWTSART
jgi:hypothetical protein